VVNLTGFSPQPLDFKEYEKNPILGADEKSWDNLALVAPHVVIHNGLFYMFYTGFVKDGSGAIGLATSANGFNFQKHPGNPWFFLIKMDMMLMV